MVVESEEATGLVPDAIVYHMHDTHVGHWVARCV